MQRRRPYVLKATIALVDALVVAVAAYAAYAIRFDFSQHGWYRGQLHALLPIIVLTRLSALYYAQSYHFLWRYAGLNDLLRVLKASLAGLMVLAVINYFRNYPLSLLIAAGFFISALFHQGILHLLPRVRRTQLIVAGAIIVSVIGLTVGFFTYSIARSAPATVADLPLGEYLVFFEFPHDLGMPRGVLVMETILSFIMVSSVRIMPRLVAELLNDGRSRRGVGARRTLIYGAGDLGEMLVRGLRSMRHDVPTGRVLVGFVDDDPAKQRVSIHGVKVLGARDQLADLIDLHHVNELLIAVTSFSEDDLREIAAICWQKRVSVRRVPGLANLVDPELGIRNLEEVNVEELLGRPEIALEPDRVRGYLKNRIVLVTGAGGSIGSELCRQIGRFKPATLILLGKGENSIWAIQGELIQRYPRVRVVAVIGDVGSPSKMENVFRTYCPDVVFHAAAHKHVPFMEDNPEESVLNNIFGTRNLAEAAVRYGCSRFVMVSSDKAVKPTSVMGATKRVAELVLQRLAGAGETQFITVRFGNVLRSRGSVILLFEQQIAAGGPVTVTDPDMRRYFMSIPEAVRLVLHSGAIGQGGDLCILDMGEQVRIADLAANMIRMTGKVPGEDIEIQYTGVRPGEKLYEELFTEAEARTLRKIDKIFLATPDAEGGDMLHDVLPKLREAALGCRRRDLVTLLSRIIPSYQPALSGSDAPTDTPLQEPQQAPRTLA